MPGSVATFCSCSSERSARTAARISSSANTRAGTRMSDRAEAGISYSVSSMRCRSDIQDDSSVPDAVLACEAKIVVGRRLDEWLELRAPADQRRVHGVRGEPYVDFPLGDEALRF